MARIHLALQQRHSVDGDQLILEALDIRTALAIADLNLSVGSAELWEGERRVSRLTRHGGQNTAFWEIVPEPRCA